MTHGPNESELAARLAWVVRNANGSYNMSPEAHKYYVSWYEGFRAQLMFEQNATRQHLQQRLDLHLLKLALIIRVQRYEPATDIQLSDIQAADNILRQTYKYNFDVIDEVGQGPFRIAYNYTSLKLKERGRASRSQLLKLCSPKQITADWVTKVVSQLVQEGRVKIALNGDENRLEPSSNGKEVYFWIEREPHARVTTEEEYNGE